jgi:hypothetical protein
MDKETPAHRAALSKEDYHKLTGFDGDWRDTWWNDEFLCGAVKVPPDAIATSSEASFGWRATSLCSWRLQALRLQSS